MDWKSLAFTSMIGSITLTTSIHRSRFAKASLPVGFRHPRQLSMTITLTSLLWGGISLQLTLGLSLQLRQHKQRGGTICRRDRPRAETEERPTEPTHRLD